MAQAHKAMSKGFFKKSDPLSAYSYYNKAAGCYKSTSSFQNEAYMRISAADCSMQTESYNSAATDYKLAAQCFGSLDEYKEACSSYRKSATAAAAGNDMGRCGEMLVLGAQELARGGLEGEAGLKFEEAVRVFVPDDFNK